MRVPRRHGRADLRARRHDRGGSTWRLPRLSDNLGDRPDGGANDDVRGTRPTRHAGHARRAEFERAEARTAHNYHPLPVVVAHAEGAWMTDVDGRRYLDLLAGYSALNFGHGHPALLAAAHEQLDQLTLTSRAFVHDQFGDFCAELGDLCGKELVLPMNTGAEAVETAIKVARKWGYEVKGVPADQARDHRRRAATSTAAPRPSSASPTTRTPAAASARSRPASSWCPTATSRRSRPRSTPDTVAVLLEPIQGEGGVVIPPDGYLRGVRELCTAQQRAVRRRRDPVRPRPHRQDVRLRPRGRRARHLRPRQGARRRHRAGVRGRRRTATCSACSSPGQHGSTFGGNPLACAVGRDVVEHARDRRVPGPRRPSSASCMRARLDALVGHGVVGVRTRGLWAGVDIDPAVGTGRQVCEALMERGVLAKDTHGSTIRLAPPLVISEDGPGLGPRPARGGRRVLSRLRPRLRRALACSSGW